jgi:hypothetical protein
MNFILLVLLSLMVMARADCAAAQPAPQASTPDASTPPAAKPPPPKPASPAKPVGKPAKLEHIQKAQAEGIMGEAVVDAKGDTIGRITDVLINAQGTPHAAVIEFAGFLGVGNRNIAVEWKALDFKVVKNRIVISLDLDAAKLKAMPTYKTDAKSVPVAVPAKPKPAQTSPAKAIPAPPAQPEAKPAIVTPNSAQQGDASPAGAQ